MHALTNALKIITAFLQTSYQSGIFCGHFHRIFHGMRTSRLLEVFHLPSTCYLEWEFIFP